MKINKLKINSYGKLKNKEINLENKINLIYGKNEAGKSTIINFINDMFYGTLKNKKGKKISNFDKYKPWVGEDFSGKIEYELDNNSKYEIFRDFNKKNPIIYNEQKEDISKEFNIDKAKGNEFFYEQTKIDEDLFLSTIAINQNEIILEKDKQDVLIQKIANMIGTGTDNTSFKLAIDRINRRQLNEIGSKQSREKPINIVEKNIENLTTEKQKLSEYEDYKFEIEEEENNLEKIISEEEEEKDFLNEIKKINEKKQSENEKINIKEKFLEENRNKINLINNEVEKIKKNNKNIIENNAQKNNKIKNNKNKKIINKLNLFLIILILINIIQFIFIKNNLKYIFLFTIPAYLIFYIFFILNNNKKIKNYEKIENNNLEKINNEINNLISEKNIIEKNSINLENEINELKNKNNLLFNLEIEKIKNNYLKKLEKNKIFNFINLNNLEKINFEIENVQKNLNNNKLKLHSLELDEKNIEPNLNKLAKIEEDLVYNNEKKETLEKLNKSMNLAKEILEESYEKMRNSVSPKFTEELSNNISKITNGKYKNIGFNEEIGLVVELENGNYVSASNLSIGTIDQLYLSLRLSIINELSKEIVPIFLDETFAFFDDERLENILKYLNDGFNDRQIIIFSCTKREKNILEKNNIKFNFIEI